MPKKKKLTIKPGDSPEARRELEAKLRAAFQRQQKQKRQEQE